MNKQIRELEDGRFAVGEFIKSTKGQTIFLTATETDTLAEAMKIADQIDRDDQSFKQ